MKKKRCSICRCEFNNNDIVLKWNDSEICTGCFEEQTKLDQLQKDIDSLIEKMEKIDPEQPEEKEIEFFTEDIPLPSEKRHTGCITPKEIVAYLDKYIVGQEAAKRTLAVAVFNHMQRISDKTDFKIPKANILIQGSTGTGKTYVISILAKLLDIPLAIVDASTLTEASYKGKNVDSILFDLFQAAEQSIEKMERGIVYLDEFDKLSGRFSHDTNENGVGAGVQRQLLKLIEGCRMQIPIKNKQLSANTENILFICGGAFVGLKNSDTAGNRKIGFCRGEETGDSTKNSDRQLCPQDFIDYGFIPEIVGRLPVIVSLNDLSEADLKRILLDTKDSVIKQYQSYLELCFEIELEFTQDAIDEIVHKAFALKTGARSLNSIVEGIMRKLLYIVPSDTSIQKCIIDKAAVTGESEPKIIREEEMVV